MVIFALLQVYSVKLSSFRSCCHGLLQVLISICLFFSSEPRTMESFLLVLLIYSFLSMLYIPYLFQNSALHFQILCVFNKLKNVFLPQTLLKLIKVVDHRYISLIFSKSPSSVSFCWLVSPLGFGTHVHCSFFAFEQLRNDLFPLITLTKCLLEGKWVLTVNRLLCHFFLYLIMMKIIMNICNL